MNIDRDPIDGSGDDAGREFGDEVGRELARLEPPAARPGIRDDVLAEFDRASAPRTLAFRRRRVAIFVAAAAVIVFAFLLFHGALPTAPNSPVAMDEVAGVEPAAMNALLARIDKLRTEIDRLPPPLAPAVDPTQTTPADSDAVAVNEPPPELLEPTFGAADAEPVRDAVTERALVAVGNDPALLRLITARQNESFDRDDAARRYRELLQEYPDGPASTAARARLEVLAR